MDSPDAPSSRVRRYWTEEEDRILRREAAKQLNSEGAVKQWNLIASKLEGRTNKDCRKRWNKVGREVNKGPWSKDEDDRLRKGVQQYDTRWTLVAECVQTRHADQCAKRWYDFLDPTISHKDWNSDEEARLLSAVQAHGRSWKIIREKEFPNRSTTDIKNRYVIMERSGRAERRRSLMNSPSPSQQLDAFGGGAAESADDTDMGSSAELDADDFFASSLTSPASHLTNSGFGMHDDSAMSNVLHMDPTLQFTDTLFNSSDILPSSLPSSSGPSLSHTSNPTPSDTPLSDSSQMPGPHISHGDGFLVGDLDLGLGMDIVGQQSQLTSASLPGPATLATAGLGSDSGSGHTYRLILEDLKPDALLAIVDMLVRSKSTVKMKMVSG